MSIVNNCKFDECPCRVAGEPYCFVYKVLQHNDLCKLECIRKSIEQEIVYGVIEYTDIFILQYGESSDRFCTKIGGTPCLPRNIDWPTDANGRKLPFLAQFNFKHSIDICGDVPGNILMIFYDYSHPADSKLVWCNETDDYFSDDRHAAHHKAYFPTLHGERRRVPVYPAAEMRDDKSWSGVSVGTRWIASPFYATQLIAMQITKCPYEPQPNNLIEVGDSFICSLPELCVESINTNEDLTNTIHGTHIHIKSLTLKASYSDDYNSMLYVIKRKNGSYDIRVRCV